MRRAALGSVIVPMYTIGPWAHLSVSNPVHRENNLSHCKANRERVERACRRAFLRRLANRVSLEAIDFA